MSTVLNMFNNSQIITF